MREIKFRIFSPDEGMVTNEVDCFLSFDRSGVVNDLNVPAIHVMQYTGLKDKNGKECYEGDVWLMNGLESQPMIVCFDNGGFCSKATWGNYVERDDGYTYWAMIDGAIIGNIHENPELLIK